VAMRLLSEIVSSVAFLNFHNDVRLFGNQKCRNLSTQSTQAGDVSDIRIENSLTNQKYNNLLDWLKSKEGVYINEKIELRPSSRGGGYGAFITDGSEVDNSDTPVIEPDEVLFTIPRSLCITLDDALNDKDLGEGFRKLIERAGPGGNTVVLAGYMAAEWLKCLVDDDNSSNSRNINSMNNNINESDYGPYLATLPWERGINSQEHVLYWNNDEIESTLLGSMCYGEALDLRKEVSVAIKVLNTIVGRAKAEKEATAFRLPWERKEKLPVDEIAGLSDAITGAFVSVLTRAFEDDFGNEGDDKEKLVPLLDMLQHSDEPNVSHSMKKVDGTVEVRARKALYDGDEILNQYRSELEESMPYHRFFTRFGFVPGINESMQNLFQDKSSIFFAQKAEV
jgi:SET domain